MKERKLPRPTARCFETGGRSSRKLAFCPGSASQFAIPRRCPAVSPYLDKFDIFGITGSGFEVKLVERRAAPECHRVAQVLVRKYLNERVADHEHLLDLEILDPRMDEKDNEALTMQISAYFEKRTKSPTIQ